MIEKIYKKRKIISLRNRIVQITAIGVCFLAIKPIVAADGEQSLFDYGGEIFFQGFYLERDLPFIRPDELEKTDTPGNLLTFPYESLCNSPEPVRSVYNPEINSRCREEEDFYRMRLRANFSYRASPYVDILYGLEVGYITFGREENQYGPDSGGGGSGRTNLETQQLLMKIHTPDNRASVSAGVFNFSTPLGMVVANSGAGFKGDLEFPEYYSTLEGIYIRSEDRSRRDDDSNGFSDSNFRDVHLGILEWRFTGISNVRSRVYGVYREDVGSRISDDDRGEISQLYWGGLFLTLSAGTLDFVIHGVGNRGSFSRYNNFDHLSSYNRILILRTPEASAFQSFLPRERHNVNAGAGNLEISWRATDVIRFVLSAAGATGRLGLEPDGSLSDYRSDQFRTALSAYQFSDIALDTTGGYSIFPGGRLTGLNARAVRLVVRIYESLESQISYSSIYLNHGPTLHENAYYTQFPFYVAYVVDPAGGITPVIDTAVKFTQHPGIRESTLYLGEEWNIGFTFRPWDGFILECRGAWFDSGDGYKILKDVQYGDDVRELSFSVKQEF